MNTFSWIFISTFQLFYLAKSHSFSLTEEGHWSDLNVLKTNIFNQSQLFSVIISFKKVINILLLKVHQHGSHDVMWKRSISNPNLKPGFHITVTAVSESPVALRQWPECYRIHTAGTRMTICDRMTVTSLYPLTKNGAIFFLRFDWTVLIKCCHKNNATPPGSPVTADMCFH